MKIKLTALMMALLYTQSYSMEGARSSASSNEQKVNKVLEPVHDELLKLYNQIDQFDQNQKQYVSSDWSFSSSKYSYNDNDNKRKTSAPPPPPNVSLSSASHKLNSQNTKVSKSTDAVTNPEEVFDNVIKPYVYDYTTTGTLNLSSLKFKDYPITSPATFLTVTYVIIYKNDTKQYQLCQLNCYSQSMEKVQYLQCKDLNKYELIVDSSMKSDFGLISDKYIFYFDEEKRNLSEIRKVIANFDQYITNEPNSIKKLNIMDADKSFDINKDIYLVTPRGVIIPSK